jgi:hypothetical protein
MTAGVGTKDSKHRQQACCISCMNIIFLKFDRWVFTTRAPWVPFKPEKNTEILQLWKVLPEAGVVSTSTGMV